MLNVILFILKYSVGTSIILSVITFIIWVFHNKLTLLCSRLIIIRLLLISLWLTLPLLPLTIIIVIGIIIWFVHLPIIISLLLLIPRYITSLCHRTYRSKGTLLLLNDLWSIYIGWTKPMTQFYEHIFKLGRWFTFYFVLVYS